jgi:2-polyprenyl-6-methoxyphenol hydroxylase-like FAD-dependent oxidoreductase
MPDVIVVGAGPVGLTLAGDLAAAGVNVTILEQRRGEHDPNVTRAFVVHARTLEMLDSRGLLDSVLGSKVGWATEFNLWGGVQIDLSRLPSDYQGLLVTPQYNVDGPLLDRARRLGVEIRYETKVVKVLPDDTGVTAQDSTNAAYRARYLVGADGVHSMVREAVGLAFPGTPLLRRMMLADVKLTHPPPLGRLRGNGTRGSLAFLAPYGDEWWRVIAWDQRVDEMSPEEPVDLDHLISIVRRTHGTDYGIHSPRWVSQFDADERLAPTYRVGRVLLAGDAAHQHSPAGGQGMNLGIQDAVNLSWRLALVVRGAPDRLLDGYTAERRPVAIDVLRSSHVLVRVALLKTRLAQALRRPVGRTLLRIPPLARKIAGQLSGIGIRYPRPRGAHRLVGTRATDIVLPDGTRLYRALHPGRFLLLSPHPAADGWRDRIHPINATIAGAAALIRPDGYVAWAGNSTPRDQPSGAVLEEWLGPRRD